MKRLLLFLGGLLAVELVLSLQDTGRREEVFQPVRLSYFRRLIGYLSLRSIRRRAFERVVWGYPCLLRDRKGSTFAVSALCDHPGCVGAGVRGLRDTRGFIVRAGRVVFGWFRKLFVRVFVRAHNKEYVSEGGVDKSGRSDEIEVNNKPESIKHGSGWWEFIDPAPRFMLDEKTKTWVPAYPVKCPINPAWKNAQYEVQPPDFTPLPKPRPARSIDPAGPDYELRPPT